MNRKKKRFPIYQVIINVVAPLIFGGLFYIFFRSSSIYLFNLFKITDTIDLINSLRSFTLPIVNQIPSSIIYSLPDGIWVYSGTYSYLIIWNNSPNNYLNYFWITSILLISITTEILQKINLFPGTFSYNDIIFMFLFFILSIRVFNFNKREKYE